jgi:hypothetical protein
MSHSTDARRHLAPTLASVALMLGIGASHAAPVSFDVGAASLTAGVGYGVDNGANGENGGTLLDVQFTSAFAPQQFVLTNAGDRFSFDVARVSFREPNDGNGANLGIRTDELDGLGLMAGLTVMGPAAATLSLTAIVSAFVGAIDDAAVDYAIAWQPLEVGFGDGGRYRVSLDALSFTGNGSQTLRATVELLPPQRVAAAAVPEPGSMALVGLALAGAAAVRRRRAAC